jgi:hypothetical protein
MNPFITLKIENQIPTIVFHNRDGIEKDLTLKKENIEQEILAIAKNLEIPDISNPSLSEVLDLASEGHHDLINTSPDIITNSLEFDLEGIIGGSLVEAEDSIEDYSEVELTDQLREEIDRNNKIDILASIIDQIYNILIAKTLLAAYELEINEIHFRSDYNYARLIEKMGNEIQKLNLEFIID